MSDTRPDTVPRPGWAWAFAIACFLIPVATLGGAIPAGIGFGAGFYCLAVTRESQKTNRRKLAHCAAATAVAWTLLLAMVGGVTIFRVIFPGSPQTTHTGSAGDTQTANLSDGIDRNAETESSALSDPATRRDIYKKATSLRAQIERLQDRKSERRARGLDTDVSDRQIEHVRGMQEDRLAFTARFYKITREQLDAIIAEGDREGWSGD